MNLKKSTEKRECKQQAANAKPNEKKVPKRYQLMTLREGGYYEPLTDEEFA